MRNPVASAGVTSTIATAGRKAIATAIAASPVRDVRHVGSLGTQQGADGRAGDLVIIYEQDSHGPLAIGGAHSHRSGDRGSRVELRSRISPVSSAGGFACRLRL